MADKVQKAHGAALLRVVEVMDQLLGPQGCPWDRQQTVESLRPCLVEETYEVLEAIDLGDISNHCEELGDLLLQVIFQAAIRRDAGYFDIDAVANRITDKLIRRHPHVFAAARASTAAEVEVAWEAIKEQEERQKVGAGTVPWRGALEGVPTAMPALSRAQKISARAATFGLDWPTIQGCRGKVLEELDEIESARVAEPANPQAVIEEVGDLLFAVVSLARKLGVDAESSLRRGTRKFEHRFSRVEKALAERGQKPSQVTPEGMAALWQESKDAER